MHHFPGSLAPCHSGTLGRFVVHYAGLASPISHHSGLASSLSSLHAAGTHHPGSLAMPTTHALHAGLSTICKSIWHMIRPPLFPACYYHTGDPDTATSRRQSARSDLPIFTPTTGARGGNGLDLLAAAAFSSGEKHAEEGYAAEPIYVGSLSKPGPFNPAASLAPKVAKKILDLDFIEMSEVTLDMPPDPIPGRPPPPGRSLITELSQWIERYSVMAGLLCKRFPHKAPELFAYLAMQRDATSLADGWHTTGNLEGRPWLGSVWIGQCQTNASTLRPSLAVVNRSRGARFAYRTIIGLRGVPITRTTSGRHCSLGPS